MPEPRSASTIRSSRAARCPSGSGSGRSSGRPGRSWARAAKTQAVRRIIKGKPERFPPDREPWAVYYPEPSDALRIGGPDEEKAEREEISRVYSGFIDALIANMGEFVDAMEQLERGERWVANGSVDLKKVETFVARWKKKQGELQEEILRFRTKEPGLYQKTMTAYLNLLELGKMVSKRSWNLQQDTLEGRGVTEIINPAAHPCFDRNYRYVVDARSLSSRLEKIRSLLQPGEAREAEDVRAAVESEAPDDEEGGAAS